MQISDITINVTCLGNISIKLEITKIVLFREIGVKLLSLHHYQKKQHKKYGFVFILTQQIVQEENLNKQFQQYSNHGNELIFLVDQELIDYINRNSNILDPPAYGTLQLTQTIPAQQLTQTIPAQQLTQTIPAQQLTKTIPAIKIEIILWRQKEMYSLNLDDNQMSLLNLYEYLIDQNIVRKTQIAAFLHQLSATFYEFNTFQTKLSDIQNFERDSKIIYVDDELLDQLRPQNPPQKINDQKEEIQQLREIPEDANGITIYIISEDGPYTKSFQFVKISPEIQVYELKQRVCKHLGYNDPSVVDVDLFTQNGHQINSQGKQNRSLSDLNLASKEVTIKAKTRWIGGQDQ